MPYSNKARNRFFCSVSKKGFDDGDNENTAGKAWHVIHYTQEQLNRRRKALVPENKLKEAEFW